MPRIRRYYPASHMMNRDPEFTELRRQFADWMGYVWHEMLAWGDHTEGELKGKPDAIAESLASVSLTNRPRLARNCITNAFQYMQQCGWIRIETDRILILNYAKYHGLWEGNKSHEGNNNRPSLPSFLPSFLPTDQTKEEEKVRSCADAPSAPPPDHCSNGHFDSPTEKESVTATVTSLPVGITRAQPKEWPDEDRWLLEFLRTQHVLPQLRAVPASESQIEDYGWWEQVNESVNGVDPEFIRREFANMGAYLTEKPRKRPLPKGWRTFIRSWLQRTKEHDRRQAAYPVRAPGH